MFGINIIYLVFAASVGAATVILIPRENYKHFFLYGLIFGGLADAFIVVFLTELNLIQYKNMGVFNVFDYFSIWTPLTWMFVFMIFFYFLPVRKSFLIPYIIAFSVLNIATGRVMSQLGLFELIGIQKYLSPFVFLLWYSISAWAYLHIEKISLQ
ncbi:hypothetical protein [Natronospora cellulosivora (SeqCode)]